MRTYSGVIYKQYNHTIRSITPNDDIQSETENDSKSSQKHEQKALMNVSDLGLTPYRLIGMGKRQYDLN